MKPRSREQRLKGEGKTEKEKKKISRMSPENQIESEGSCCALEGRQREKEQSIKTPL